MRDKLTDRIALALKSGKAFTLLVVFTGKVKPVEFALFRVFDDGFDMTPFPDDGQSRAFYPLSGIQSVRIDWIDDAPETQGQPA